MKKINFEKYTLYKGISHKQKTIQNIKEELSDLIYTKGQGIKYHALALKIYNSQGEILINDEEEILLKNFIDQLCSPIMIDSFKENLINFDED